MSWLKFELSDLPRSYSCDLIFRYPGGRSDEIRPGPSVVATTPAEAFDLICDEVNKLYPNVPEGDSILVRIHPQGSAQE